MLEHAFSLQRDGRKQAESFEDESLLCKMSYFRVRRYGALTQVFGVTDGTHRTLQSLEIGSLDDRGVGQKGQHRCGLSLQ